MKDRDVVDYIENWLFSYFIKDGMIKYWKININVNLYVCADFYILLVLIKNQDLIKIIKNIGYLKEVKIYKNLWTSFLVWEENKKRNNY